MHTALVIAFIGALVFGAHLFVALFARTRVPDVLLLILIGLALGPVTHLVEPSQLGSVGPVFTTVTLVLILFESGVGLQIDTLRRALRGTLILATLNFFATGAVVAAAAWKMTQLGPMRSLMLGAMLGGTSPAVVIPMAAQLGMGREASALLFLESAVSDVLSIVIALALLDGRRMGVAWGPVAGSILASFFFASVLGGVGAVVWSSVLSRVRNLQNGMFTTAAFVFLVYGVAEIFGYSGAIASLVFGIGLGNTEWLRGHVSRRTRSLAPVELNEHEKAFFAEIVFLLKTFFFVYIGLSVRFENQWWITFGLLVTLLIFAARIPIVRFGVDPGVGSGDASRMAAMAPKGLAAAVLASLALQQGVEGGEMIQNSTYAVVLFSIVLTSVLVFLQDKTFVGGAYRWVFRRFGVGHAEPQSSRDAEKTAPEM